MEISTPFVSIRSILSILNLKKSTLYVVNGLLMLVSFFICRILMWPMLYWWYSRIIQKNVFEVRLEKSALLVDLINKINFSLGLQAVISLPLSCKLGTLVLFLPQVYWFYLMVKGAFKVFDVNSITVIFLFLSLIFFLQILLVDPGKRKL